MLNVVIVLKVRFSDQFFICLPYVNQKSLKTPPMYYFAYYNFELIIRYLYFQKVSLDGLIDKTQIIHHISQKRLLFVQIYVTILFRK